MGGFRPAAERFWEKVVAQPSGCWLWIGARSNTGYGSFGLHHHYGESSKGIGAHRWAYEELISPIPAELILDHLCRNRSCVNPTHLEPVTQRINNLRGIAPGARAVRDGACINGHAFDLRNTYFRRRGGRDCRTCHRDQMTRRRQRLKAAA